MARERAADAARADDADLERLLSRRNPRVDERRGTEDEAGSEQQRATRESLSERSCTHGIPRND